VCPLSLRVLCGSGRGTSLTTKDTKVRKEKRFGFDLFSSYKNILEWRAALNSAAGAR
jgi:hypothetical protein